MTTRRLLFVAGLARSGTTTLRQVLTAHPEIALGGERYKRLWGSDIDQLTADRFEKSRFFDFSDGLTNLTPASSESMARRYAALEPKWDDATYVGDKMTTIRFKPLHEMHPEARFVFIVRNVDQVALSWDKRAHNPDDRAWPERSDGAAAVEAWNRALRRIGRAVRRHPDVAMVVEYEQFFGDADASSLKQVLAFLDLPWVDEVATEFAQAHGRFVSSVAGRDRTLPPQLRATVDEKAERSLWDAVVGTGSP